MVEQPAKVSVLKKSPKVVSTSESVTARSLAVLAAFENSSGALSVARIAQRAHLPVSTTYRLVHELETWGALDKNVDGKYQVGMRIWELGQLAGLRLRDRRARPFLQDLFDLTHENVHMAVRQGAQALYVDKIYGSRKVPVVSRVGGRLPLHATAVGRVLLAAEPKWFIEAYLDKELEAPTMKTMIDRTELSQAIKQTADQGYSIAIEQMRVGACSVAVPLIVDGQTVASIGLVLEAHRSGEIKRLLPMLQGTVDRIQKALSAR